MAIGDFIDKFADFAYIHLLNLELTKAHPDDKEADEKRSRFFAYAWGMECAIIALNCDKQDASQAIRAGWRRAEDWMAKGRKENEDD